MTKKNRHLITEDIPTLIKQLAIPSITGIFFNTMYNVVDTWYAGLISTEAIAALSICFMLFFLIVGLGYGFSSAITSLVGNANGSNKHFLAKVYGQKGILFIMLIGATLMLFGFIFEKELFILLGAKETYLELALAYMDVILMGTVFFMANFALNAILIANGDTKSYRNTLIFGFFANLALNPLFIYGFLFIPAMGVAGIALATVLIQIINMCYLAYKVHQLEVIDFLNFRYYLPHLHIYKTFIIQGVPNSLNMLTMAIGSILMTYFVSHYGMEAVAAFGIGYRVEQIMLMPSLGLSTAALTLVANNYGAKKYERVKEVLMTTLKYGFTISAFGVVFLYLTATFIIGIFTTDSKVVEIATGYIYIEVWVFFAYVTLFICVSTMQGIKKPKMILFIALYRQIIAKFIVAFLIVKYFNLEIMILWIGVALMIYSAALFAYYHTKSLLNRL